MVVVTPRRRSRPVPERDSGFFCDVSECAIVIVVIKPILPVVGDVDIRPAIVVVIADGDSESPTLICYTGFLSDVSKRAVMIVVKKHGLRRGFCALQSCD